MIPAGPGRGILHTEGSWRRWPAWELILWDGGGRGRTWFAVGVIAVRRAREAGYGMPLGGLLTLWKRHLPLPQRISIQLRHSIL